MPQENIALAAPRPLIFGEVLFDHFPDGSRVLGGAPFNVAWHLQGFGVTPLFLSRIGKDEPGQEILQKMDSWGMDTRGIQRDHSHPSGTVQVSLDNGQPHFEICPEQAYDHIERAPIEALIDPKLHAIFYFGTLAARSRTSRETLHWLSETYNIPAFVDINLRPPWWNRQEVDWDLDNAFWLKLNNDEFDLISESSQPGERVTIARNLLNHHGCKLLIITLGAEGALLVDSESEIHAKPSLIADIVDTVGAGDAFSSVILLGLLRGWKRHRMLTNALEFAAAICRRRGATVSDFAFYRDFIQRWET